ncbi:redox proteins related to the succinate dehydrogenases and fumarate reductases [Amycolatopsis camponoti]|uniref:Redox proteins related to the succinate dehydrogenases and fumarate reductases n=1 Tax=Amycolatopsis camponoti TaxID=2606593 RepID=A0A6I8LP30_9PSEU|nr:FAD-binding protein [Amycolatopsis camponoti]VVJ16929.1 redox proteins related to the succinate dehydrogenases and fumarate reductases [Amycolatopsis camponoti]
MDELVADVIIVGFGAAGACAALEAADAGADVILVERFGGGGASAVSGGVVYAGGGTAQQLDAGVDDSVDAMYAYLRLETGDVVAEETLRRFCEGSREMITWLEGNGVPFEGSLCPYKTSYPSDAHYLYYSGSEAAGGFRDAAKPAPRGHRVKGPGTSGKMLMTRLQEAVRKRGIRVLTQTNARGLVRDDDGRVTGLVADTLRDAPARVRARHRRLARYSAKPGIYVPSLRKSLHRRVERLERAHGRELRIIARRGVVLAAGGFIANREMVREHAPAYRGGLPLGTSADDGSGIRLGVEAGAATGELGRISAWRFVTPPSAFLGGIIVDAGGRRVIDESRYGAAVGEKLIEDHESKGWLLVDAPIVADARRDTKAQSQWFQGLQLRYLLRRGRVTGATVEEAARKAGVDPRGLRASVEAYHGAEDPMGKPAEFARRLDHPPFSLIDISVRPNLGYPTPMLTLGGLVVDEDTGAVRSAAGEPIAGLYAAGRTAVGICSRSYVSGLSLADCVFSGRRAGINSALAQGVLDKNENVF